MNEINKIWQKVLEIIAQKVGESIFELWFSPIKLLDIKNSKAFIEVPNRFFKDWIEDNFPSIISDSFYQIIGNQIKIHYIITGKEQELISIERKKTSYKKGLFQS